MENNILDENDFSLDFSPPQFIKERVRSGASKPKVCTSHKRCTKTDDWVEIEFGDSYSKPEKGKSY